MGSLEDRVEIQDTIFRWCRAIDRLDFDAIFGCFHEDAHDDHVFYRGNITGLVDCLRDRHKKISFSMHAVSNILIEFETNDRAFVESYVQVIQRRPLDEKGDVVTADSQIPYKSQVSEVFCRYVDHFDKRAGDWRIRRRILLIDSAREYVDQEPLHRLPDASAINRGKRSLDDAVYCERARSDVQP